MKKIKILYIALLLTGLSSVPSYGADVYPGDTSIYGYTSYTLQPNVMIIFDNSGSMRGEIATGPSYDATVTYPETEECDGDPCNPTAVYRWRKGDWRLHIDDISEVACTRANDALSVYGTYQGRLRTDGSCRGSRNSYATGNYVNWLNTGVGYRPKLDVAKEVVTNLLDTTYGVRFGVMLFNRNQGGHILGVGDSYGHSGYEAYLNDMDATFTGSMTNRTALMNSINNVRATTWTPLAETLYETYRYFSGGESAFNRSVTYSIPLQYSCQKNYVIIVTDGMSTQDRHGVLVSLCNNGDCDGDGFEPSDDPAKSYSSFGSDYLDDVAHYLYHNDILPDTSNALTHGTQNITTHTVGFGLAGVPAAETLLRETAINGGGQYFSAGSTSGLSEALRQIIATILEDNTSFVAPVLPVSPENRTFSGSRIYMGFFKPQQGVMWHGNLKKYSLSSSDGSVQDKDGAAATFPDGSLKDTATSFWSLAPDGGNVDAGGVGALLLSRNFTANPRKIYTYTGTSANLTDGTNSLSVGNASLTAGMLGAADAATRTAIINYTHGYDAYDSDSDGSRTDKRAWIMGDILHSRPLVAHYNTFTYDASGVNESNCNTNKSLIFVGSNGGMMHAFRDCNGEEAWAFVPQDLLPELVTLSNSTHNYFVDSSPALYIHDVDKDGIIETTGATPDKVILIFGERRGGNHYYALDVSNPDFPVYMGRISPTEVNGASDLSYSELGESWSEPTIAEISVDVSGTTKTKVGVFFGAGYDNAIEDITPHSSSPNTKGRGFYVMELAELDSTGYPVFTNFGSKIWGYTNSDNTLVNQSVPSEMAVVDLDGNDFVDTIYVGDTGANMWRVSMLSPITSNWTVSKIFASGGDRKIFYRPSVTQEFGYNGIYFSTGDRAHPKEKTEVDRIYMLKDTGQSTADGISESHLQDLTSPSTVPALSTHKGWYIRLTNSGEKGLAASSVISGVASYTTYEPPGISTDVCASGGRGTARLYSVDYLDASAVLSLDSTNDGNGETLERNTTVGSGIPSGVVMGIGQRGFFGLLGVGGGLPQPKVKETGGIFPTYWRELR